MTRAGFTGTRSGLSNHQKETLQRLLLDRCVRIGIHGGCVGADVDFHNLCVEIGIKTIVYPGHFAKNPSDLSFRADIEADEVRESDTHFRRNRRIVEDCDFLIGGPLTDEETRGGTWYTIGHARKVGKECIVLRREIEVTR